MSSLIKTSIYISIKSNDAQNEEHKSAAHVRVPTDANDC